MDMKYAKVLILSSFFLLYPKYSLAKNDFPKSHLDFNHQQKYQGIIPDLLNEIFLISKYRLPKKDMQKHFSTIYYVLEHTKIGEKVYWYGNQNNNYGVVYLKVSYPISYGWCSIYEEKLTVKSKVFNNTRKACKKWDKFWKFF